jgi:DNA-binding MarR family transcriptional regulator
MHIAVKGPSAGGKSEARRRTLEMFFPPEAVFSFTALSERALIYVKDDFPHKILSMGEAYNSEELKFQDYVLREMLSEGVVRYQVAQKQPDGTIETVTLEKHGPVAFMVTTTRNRLHHENETRMLSIEVDDSAEQTRRVIEKVAEVEGLNRDFASAEMKPWHDFQRWLAAGDCIVVVPFARVLSRLVKEAKAVRLRRDFGQLLRAIKAHALLHRQHRRRTKQGSIIAEIEQDYLPVRKLLADLLATAAEMKTRKTIAATVWAVKKLQLSDGASAREIAAKLKLDSSTAYRRLQAAVDAGLIENLEERPRRPGRYKVSGGEAGSTWILPLTPELREAYDAARMKPAQSSSSRTARRKT